MATARIAQCVGLARASSVHSILCFAAIVVIATSCATGGKDREQLLTPNDLKNEHVILKSGAKEPIRSAKPTSVWVKNRTSTTSDIVAGYAALSTGEFVGAVDLGKKVLEKSPADKDGLAIVATAYAMDNQYAMADFYAKMYQRFHGDSAEMKTIAALAIVSRSPLELFEIEDAIKILREAHGMDPRAIAPGLNLGSLLLETSQAKEALTVYEDVSRRCSDCSLAKLGRSIAMSRTGQSDAALAMLKEISKSEPYNADAYLQIAYISYYDKRDKNSAEKALKYVLEKPEITDEEAKRLANAYLRIIQGTRDDVPSHPKERMKDEEPASLPESSQATPKESPPPAPQVTDPATVPEPIEGNADKSNREKKKASQTPESNAAPASEPIDPEINAGRDQGSDANPQDETEK